MAEHHKPIRESTLAERGVWGICPICKVANGEACVPSGRLPLIDDKVHAARLHRAPDHVHMVHGRLRGVAKPNHAAFGKWKL